MRRMSGSNICRGLWPVLAIVFVAGAARADADEERVLYGVEAGLSVSRLGFSESFLQAETKARLHFSGGGALVIPLAQDFDLRTGLRFVRYGSRLDYDTGAGPGQQMVEFTVRQDYLSVPAILRWRDSLTGRTFVGAGVEGGALLEAEAELKEFFPSGPPTTSKEDIRGDMEPINFSVLFSAGAEFPVGAGFWHMELRYGLGLIETARSDAYEFNWKTRSFEVLFGGLW